jgi:hypothetical protein
MSNNPNKRARETRRFERQFDAFERMVPPLRRPLTAIRARGWWVVRLPLALILILGGFLAVLPVFGLWMLPIGLLLLAVDIQFLRAPLSNFVVRMRRRFDLFRRH